MSIYQLQLDATGDCLVNCAVNQGSNILENYSMDMSTDAISKLLECSNITDYKQIIFCPSTPNFKPCNETNTKSSVEGFNKLNNQDSPTSKSTPSNNSSVSAPDKNNFALRRFAFNSKAAALLLLFSFAQLCMI